MKRTTVITAAAIAGAVLFSSSPAYAWDCIRTSGSTQGQQSSSTSGQWVQTSIQQIVDSAQLPAATAACVITTWSALGEPSTFTIGTGVAGATGAAQSGRLTETDFFELAKNAPQRVMTDGHGIDHLDDAIQILINTCFTN
jgi:hypothetical protein